MLAVLEFFDYVLIGILVAVFAGGTTIASRRAGSSAASGERLRRIEEKLNLLLSSRGITYIPKSKERWQELAESNRQNEAIEEYSSQNSVSTEEAQDVVDQYMMDFRDTT